MKSQTRALSRAERVLQWSQDAIICVVEAVEVNQDTPFSLSVVPSRLAIPPIERTADEIEYSTRVRWTILQLIESCTDP